MAGQKIQQGNIWGRIGSGIGQGLNEQLPKEIERNRLASGLKELGERKDLSPFQAFAGVAGLPGSTPQIQQTAGNLLMQQNYLNSLRNQYEGNQANKPYVPTQEDISKPVRGEVPTLADPQSTEQSYKNYIPPTEQEERADAYEDFKANPARYGLDFENALKARKAITERNLQRQKAYQDQEKIAVGKEEQVKNALEDETKKLGLRNEKGLTHIHPKSYQKFEEKVLNAVRSKNDGGEGLTQEQAIKKYSKDLLQADRDYQDIKNLSAWSPRDFNRRVNELEKHFGARDERQPMMDELIANYDVSPAYAAHRSYPVKGEELKTLNEITKFNPYGSAKPTQLNDSIYEKLKKDMGKTGSPLSFAYELEQRGKDARGWLNYLTNHRDNLEVWQADQLSKNVNSFDLKDEWLRAWEK